MEEQIKIDFLDDHRNLIPTLESYFKTEWDEYYGQDGPGDALADIQSLCNIAELPIGLVAIKSRVYCGSVALRQHTASHKYLSPWVTSLHVAPDIRRQGIGTMLINAVENLSKDVGYSTIYARSATAVHFFKKNNWMPFDRIGCDDMELTIFKKELKP